MPGPAAAAEPGSRGPAGPWLVGFERQVFAGGARVLDDPANRADLATYLTDLTQPYPDSRYSVEESAPDWGQSYGEMAEALIRALVPPDRPVDLLVLAYAIHDAQPGRATATYLSSVCPGTPLSFAISDQGTAAAFTGLRIVRDQLATGTGRRALLIALEQAGLPYPSAADRPAEHRGVALLFDSGAVRDAGAAGDAGVPAGATGRLVGLRQRPNLAADSADVTADPAAKRAATERVATRAAADLGELSAGNGGVRVVANPALAEAWPGRPDDLRVVPAGQPTTGLWWQLLDELSSGPDLVVAADYDPELGYLCLAAFQAG